MGLQQCRVLLGYYVYIQYDLDNRAHRVTCAPKSAAAIDRVHVCVGGFD